DEVRTFGYLWALSIPAVAGGFLAGLLRRRAVVGDVLSRLSLMIAQPLDSLRLRDLLADELGDPQVEILVPSTTPGRWRDSRGRPASRSEAIAQGLAVTTIDEDTGVVLVHDPELRDDEELFRSVCALVHATVEHERTVARLARSLAELEE